MLCVLLAKERCPLLIRFLREAYAPETRTLTLYVAPITVHLDGEFAEELGDSSEDIGDLQAPEGVLNFAMSKYPAVNPTTICIVCGKETVCALPLTEYQKGTSEALGASLKVPGVTQDPHGVPLADPSSSHEDKLRAVIQVAKSQLGAPYIWGHSEDTGQQGFDYSSFTQFVYRRALGYRFTRIGREQATSVGVPVAAREMRAGDLLIFSGGAHVGIHMGDDQMISQGGGRGRIGYLRLDPGSYWRQRLCAVKRMF